ncbi:MAG: aminotransferase class V-fold PLP-dependent enzyme [Defluviitaleaceae bacterium]|nr:aminotransferase class V-fold PLP-dependent enzyme [Defluviitaleaceae bacterium]
MIYLDNASTTMPFKAVIEEVAQKLENYGSIGRGSGVNSDLCTEIYEGGRDKVKRFFGADDPKYTMFYTDGTTDGMNKLASALTCRHGVLVVSTRMEHHANDLPWKERATVEYAEVDAAGHLVLQDFAKHLKNSRYENMQKYVTVTAASNVTGYINPVHEIARIAHANNAKIIVDGAQIVANRPFSMVGNTPEEDIDFFVFSAHKMYSPFGGGAVIGLTDVLNSHIPQFYGGGMVVTVDDDKATYTKAPELYEAGSPNFPSVVGMLKSMEILTEMGFDHIEQHQQKLFRQALLGLSAIPNVTLYGDDEANRIGIIPFSVGGITPEAAAERLAVEHNIALRYAAFCAHPYVRRLTRTNHKKGVVPEGLLRASIGINNTSEDINALISAVRHLV